MELDVDGAAGVTFLAAPFSRWYLALIHARATAWSAFSTTEKNAIQAARLGSTKKSQPSRSGATAGEAPTLRVHDRIDLQGDDRRGKPHEPLDLGADLGADHQREAS